jgi:MFS family permease
MMLSLCTEFWQVLLAQGFCIGLGMAALFIPSVAILSTYFTTRIAAAVGIAASGSSLGGVLYPIILYKLIPQVGFPWAVRTIGFISLATLIVPNIVMKVRILPPARRALVDVSAFKELPFMMFCLACFFAFFGLYQVFFFVQEYAIQENITSENIAFYLLSFLNAASIFGRIVPNIIADKTGPLNIISPCAIIAGILTLCLIPVRSESSLVAIVVLFGFFSGTLVSLPPTVIVHLTKDRRFIGTRLGMCFAFSSVGALISTPIGGVLINGKDEYWSTWLLGGVFSIAGGLFMVVVRVISKGWKPFIKA